MVQKICINKSGVTQFPAYLQHAHDLCFLNHDVLVELLRSGEESKVFFHRIPLIDDNDRELLKEADDIFSWLETTNRVEERTELLKRVVFPALLSDFLHFTYEALECSRKGKLTVSYALIRKPLQENLFLFEVIATAKYDFATWLVENPLKLRARHAGGFDAHIKRIGTVLSLLEQKDKFDAEYVAQLRYSKAK